MIFVMQNLDVFVTGCHWGFYKGFNMQTTAQVICMNILFILDTFSPSFCAYVKYSVKVQNFSLKAFFDLPQLTNLSYFGASFLCFWCGPVVIFLSDFPFSEKAHRRRRQAICVVPDCRANHPIRITFLTLQYQHEILSVTACLVKRGQMTRTHILIAASKFYFYPVVCRRV